MEVKKKEEKKSKKKTITSTNIALRAAERRVNALTSRGQDPKSEGGFSHPYSRQRKQQNLKTQPIPKKVSQ